MKADGGFFGALEEGREGEWARDALAEMERERELALARERAREWPRAEMRGRMSGESRGQSGAEAAMVMREGAWARESAVDERLRGTASDTAIVHFADSILEAIVRGYLGIPQGPITARDMATLVELCIDYDDIRDLSGLEYAVNLRELDANNNLFTDLSPLAGLAKLEELDLGNNPRIEDISPLGGLAALKLLGLYYCEIDSGKHPEAIANLSNLEVLFLDNNQLTEASWLAGLTKLNNLILSDNQLADISPLAGLVALNWLYLGGNIIEDVSALSALLELETLSLYDNAVRDVGPLGSLVNLKSLWLSKNEIGEIGALANLSQLELLWLEFNHIEDVSPLSANVGLRVLHLDYNERIADIASLSALTNLEELLLSRNRIEDIAPLAGLTKLTTLSVGGNLLDDIAPLAGLTRMRRLGLWFNYLGDEDLPNLYALDSLQPKGVYSSEGDCLHLTSYIGYSAAAIDALRAELPNIHWPAQICWNELTGIGEDEAVRPREGILGIRPNPFRDRVCLEIGADGRAEGSLEIYNVLGERVARVARVSRVAGDRIVEWDGRDDSGRPAGAGVYIARLRLGDRVFTRRLTRVR